MECHCIDSVFVFKIVMATFSKLFVNSNDFIIMNQMNKNFNHNVRH